MFLLQPELNLPSFIQDALKLELVRDALRGAVILTGLMDPAGSERKQESVTNSGSTVQVKRLDMI